MSTAQPFLTEPGQTQSTESAEPTDETLIRQLAAGKQDALGLLHRRYAPLIYNLAAQTLDRAAAEEIAQDVFVIIWRKADTFDPVRGAFRPWVLRIAHMRILNELRRRRRRPQVAPDPDGLRLGAMADDAPAPEETVWRDYRRETVREAITHLPPPQRQALGLAFFEELTHEQVADFLDLPLGTAKTRIRAGLRKLRVYLAPLLVAVFALGLGTVFGISRVQTVPCDSLRPVPACQCASSQRPVCRRIPTASTAANRERPRRCSRSRTSRPPPPGKRIRHGCSITGSGVPSARFVPMQAAMRCSLLKGRTLRPRRKRYR